MIIFDGPPTRAPHIIQYNAETDLVGIKTPRRSASGVDLSTLAIGITTNLKGEDYPDRILQTVADGRITTEVQDDNLLVKWKIGLNTTINPGCVRFMVDFKDDAGVVWRSREYYLQIDPALTAESLVAQYPSMFDQYETLMRKMSGDAQMAITQAEGKAKEAETHAGRAKADADRAETASKEAAAARTAVKTMQAAVATDKAAVEAAQKDVETRQTEIGTAHEDIKTKTAAVLQAAGQVESDKQAVDQAVTAFGETVTNAVKTIDDKAAAARQDVDDAASSATGAINSTAAAAETRINKTASDSAESITQQAQAVESVVSAAKTDITGMVSNAQAAESAAAQSAAQAAQSAQEAQAAADSIDGAISPALLTTTAAGTGALTMDNTADYPLQSLAITGVTLQDGTPSPNNPVTPVSSGDGGVISVKVCGKNLVDKNGVKTNYYVNASGEEVRDPSWCVATIPVFGGASIAITATTQGAAPRYCFYDDAGLLLLATQSKVINVPQSAKYAKLSIRTTELDSFMAEYGLTQTPYEPYIGQTATISDCPLMRIGNTADSVDLLSGQITRAVSEVSLDASSAWTGFSTHDTGYCVAVIEIPTLKGSNGITGALCNFLSEAGRAAIVNKPPVADGFALIPSGDHARLYVALAQSNLSDVSLDGFKAWLSDHPMKIWAEAVAPTQEQIDPTALRSYGGTTTLSVYGTTGEPSPETEIKAVLNATAVIADQQEQINDLRESISNLQSAALAAEIGGTQ